MGVAAFEDDHRYTREEFLAWYEAQPRGRYERLDGRIIAMAPERVAHVRLKSAVWLALRRSIADAHVPCEALTDGIAVAAGDSDYEPDAMVNCGDPMGSDAIHASNPVIVVEVLSPSTASTDTGAKLADYFLVPSIAHYLIVHATRRTVIHHRRMASGDIFTQIVSEGAIVMDPPGITITVEEIYEPS
jgi:Uma2 family endonuclease